MKKSLAAVALLILFQVICLAGGLALVIDLRGDCMMLHDQMGSWQCSGNANPLLPSYAAFIVLPPILVKLLFNAVKQKISWKRVIILHIVTATLVWLTLFLADTPDCGCAPPGGI
jgi:hypothetical protein